MPEKTIFFELRHVVHANRPWQRCSSQISEDRVENIPCLRFQIETSSWGGRRYLPYAFTEQGVAMLSSVLKSNRAALVNIAIMEFRI